MFEKWTKRFASKATNGAVDGVKESFNEKLETYSGIIKVGLTLAVIIFGSKKINDHSASKNVRVINSGYGGSYDGYYGRPQQPIIINNYISDGRQIPYGGQKQNYQNH